MSASASHEPRASRLTPQSHRTAQPALSPARATMLVALSACCFGAISIFTVLGTRRGAPLATLLAGRYVVAFALLVAAGEGWSRVRQAREHAVRIAVLGGGGQAAVAFLGLSALRFLPAATVAFLFYTFPAWVAVIAVVRGTERLDGRRLGALALSLAGIALMVGAPAAANAPGVLLALAAALAYAFYIPLLSRLQQGVAPAVASAFVSAGAGVIFLVGGAAAGALSLPSDQASLVVVLGAIAGLALISTAAGFILFLRGLAVIGPVRTAIVSTIEPFCTAALAALILAQPITRSTLVGGAMIGVAVLLLQLESRPQPR